MDKKLKERIVEVFDNYDDGAAETGWQKLREKYPSRPLRPIFWIPALAILLLCGTLVFLNTESQDEQNNNLIKKSETLSDLTHQQTDTLLNGSDKKEDNPVPENRVTNKNNRKFYTQKGSREKIVVDTNLHTRSLMNVSAPLNNTISFNNSSSNNPVTSQPPADQNNSNKSVSSSAQADPLLKQDSIYNNAPELTDKKFRRKRIEFEIYEGPFLNYSKGSSNKLNLRAGFNADILLNKRLSLVTGLSMARNSMVFLSKLPGSSALLFANSNSQTMGFQTLSFTAKILSLDMPVNLKYSLSRNNKFFILAGLSSSTYLDETYISNYRIQTAANTFTQHQDHVSYKKFKRFDIAKVLNLSVGTTYFIGSQELTIEPFFKHPLGNLGSQNILFGSAGAVIKMNISRKKEIVSPR